MIPRLAEIISERVQINTSPAGGESIFWKRWVRDSTPAVNTIYY